jgi:hypothetical protein
MTSLTLAAMRSYLGRSISSLNENKLNGLLAEIEFRQYVAALGFGDRISPGGWIARLEGEGTFGKNTVVFFPETILPDVTYPSEGPFPAPATRLHSIASKFHESGIHAYYCYPTVVEPDAPESVAWKANQLALPTDQPYLDFPQHLATEGFRRRERRQPFLRYNTDTARIPNTAIPEEFSKENLRVAFQTAFLCEISDLDGVFWGDSVTYPLEIKEKTVAPTDRRLGPYFGLDVGPFVKLAFYAAKRGNLRSLFVVREIDDVTRRNLVGWWCIDFEHLAKVASWIQRSGGRSMLGGQSAVVRIPKPEFCPLSADILRAL